MSRARNRTIPPAVRAELALDAAQGSGAGAIAAAVVTVAIALAFWGAVAAWLL